VAVAVGGAGAVGEMSMETASSPLSDALPVPTGFPLAARPSGMEPTTSGRFRVHDRRPRPDIDGTGPADPPEEFVLVDYPEAPIDPTAPDAGDRFDPLYAAAAGVRWRHG